MKDYRVVLNERAESQLDGAYVWWATNRSQEQAARWYNGFLRALDSLRHSPERCSLAEENSFFSLEVRQLLFGLGRRPSHRALFTIRDEMVFVISIRHVAQDAEKLGDFPE